MRKFAFAFLSLALCGCSMATSLVLRPTYTPCPTLTPKSEGVECRKTLALQAEEWCIVGLSNNPNICDEAGKKIPQLSLKFRDELQDLREKCED